MKKVLKERLDKRLADLYPHFSRSYIQSIILQGKVSVDGAVVNKPGTPIRDDAALLVRDEQPLYVGRAGEKLEHALNAFSCDVTGLVALDAGISTGGFTDCLLQRGVRKVYGIDVGYGQVHEKIRNDSRVVLYEKTNLRLVRSLPEPIDIATLDLSFISLKKVIEVVVRLLAPHGRVIALIKPQFEAERSEIARGGIVKESAVHERIIADIQTSFLEHRLVCQGVVESPLRGGVSGNKEFLGFFILTP